MISSRNRHFHYRLYLKKFTTRPMLIYIAIFEVKYITIMCRHKIHKYETFQNFFKTCLWYAFLFPSRDLRGPSFVDSFFLRRRCLRCWCFLARELVVFGTSPQIPPLWACSRGRSLALCPLNDQTLNLKYTIFSILRKERVLNINKEICMRFTTPSTKVASNF